MTSASRDHQDPRELKASEETVARKDHQDLKVPQVQKDHKDQPDSEDKQANKASRARMVRREYRANQA